MSSLFGGGPKSIPPPAPVEPIKQVQGSRSGSGKDKRKRKLAALAARMPSRYAELGSSGTGAGTSTLGGS